MAIVLAWLLAAAIFSAVIAHKRPIEQTPPLLLAFLAGLLIVPLWRQPELLLDSARYFIQAKSLSTHGIVYFLRQWGHVIPAWTDLPLLPFIYGLIFKIVGESRLAIQIFTTFLFGATVFLTCRIAKRLWDTETGFYAGLSLLAMPYLLSQVPLMLVDVPAMFFLSLALSLFLWAIDNGGGWRLALAAVVIVLTMLVKYSTWPMLLVLPLASLVYKGDKPRQRQRSALVLLGAGGMAALLLLVNLELFRRQLHILLTYQRPALKLWREGFISTFFFQIHPFVILLAGAAMYRGYVKRDRRIFIAAFSLILIAVLNIQRIRYLLPLLPLLALMAAYGLQIIRVKEIRRFVGLIIISSSLIYLYGGYLPFFKKTSMMNLVQAAAYIDQLPGDTVEVHALAQRSSGGNTALAIAGLDIFSGRKIISRQNWQKNGQHPAAHAPLRFSWQIPRPPYYQVPEKTGRVPLVIISADLADVALVPAAIIGNRQLVRQFSRQTGVFRYKTLVYIYTER